MFIRLKVVSFDRSLLNREAQRISANFARPPSSESPLKYQSASLFFNCQLGIQFRIFSWRICQSLYNEKPKAQLERCAPYWQLAIRRLIAKYGTYCKRYGAVTLKGAGWGTGGFF
jgi:hypothetical protein